MQQEDDSLLGLSQLGSLSRMAPQPRSSHQSVTTLNVQQLYNCGFSICVVTGTKSPHLLSSESDLLTHRTIISDAMTDFRQDTLFSVDVLFALAGPWVGARCALWRKGRAATPSTDSTQPSWLYRTPPVVTSRACLCRCAVVLRSHVGRVVFTNLQHDDGVSKRLEQPPLASHMSCRQLARTRFLGVLSA